VSVPSTFVARADRGRGKFSQAGGVRFTGLALPDLPGALAETSQAAMIHVAYRWREAKAPGHFSVQAYDKYGKREPAVYEKRGGPLAWMVKNGMTQAAERQGGIVRPLVRSGRLRHLILRGPYTAKATGSGSKLQVKAWWPGLPRYTYYFDPSHEMRFGRHKNLRVRPLVHNKVAEITIVTEDEVQWMRNVYQSKMYELMKRKERGGSAQGE